MAILFYDRVKETTTTTGTGTLTLIGAAINYQAFSVVGDGNQTYYSIVDDVNNAWEVGIGTYTLSGTTLSRDTVFASSNAGSLVSFGSGVKNVFIPIPADVANRIAFPGNPPTIVQVAGDTTGTDSITLTSPPTNGNLLVAMCFNPSVASAGTGWTLQINNPSGTDFGLIFTKVAGVSESATQTPLGSSPGGTGAIAMWELSGQAVVGAFVYGQSQAEQSTNPNVSPLVPNVTNMITLGACAMTDNTKTILGASNIIQDVLLNTNNRPLFAGHADLNVSGIGFFFTTFSSGTPGSKSAICLITA